MPFVRKTLGQCAGKSRRASLGLLIQVAQAGAGVFPSRNSTEEEGPAPDTPLRGWSWRTRPLNAYADRDPVDAARVLGRAPDHRVGPSRDSQRLGDLRQQRLGLRTVGLHDQLAEAGRVAQPQPAAQRAEI